MGDNVYSSKEVAEKLNISTSKLKYYTQRFHRFLSEPPGQGRKRYRPEDLAVLKQICDLMKDHTASEVESILEASNSSANAIEMYSSDSMSAALEVIGTKTAQKVEGLLKGLLEEAMSKIVEKVQPLQPDEIIQKAADEAANKAIEKVKKLQADFTDSQKYGKLDEWIDSLYKEYAEFLHTKSDLKELMRYIYSKLLERWKKGHI